MNNDEIRTALMEELDNILDTIHEDLLITDDKGYVLKVSPTFEDVYGIKQEEAIGMTVYQLEESGYFKPSIIAVALKENKKVTLQQKNNKNRDILVTASPIFQPNNKIKFVVSYSRDITEMIQLQKQFSTLVNKIEKYEAEIDELKRKNDVAGNIVFESKQIKDIVETINRIADFDVNVLLTGPSGVGKTMFAKEIHRKSNRNNNTFVDINCAAIPETLLESELFGFEKGSFTGANTNGKIGLIELADNGTLLLDEISEMPLNLQAKLLKTIQDKEIKRIGGTKIIKVNFRLIVATNRNLEQLVSQGAFREDLYYRLNVVNIDIPPLKDRTKDIMPLCNYFLNKFNKKFNVKKQFNANTLVALLKYDWPGNVRELANVIERAIVTSEGEDIKKDILPKKISRLKSIDGENYDSLQHAIEELEGEMIRAAYEKYATSEKVGKALKISQATAYRKISKYVFNQK